MNLNNPTRRNFLTSMAILSAGAAFGSIPDLLFSGQSIRDFQRQWASFCVLSGGVLYGNLSDDPSYKMEEACKGHQYKTGQAIFFRKEGIVAIPVWIFWNRDLKKPSDMFITFFEKKVEGLKKTMTYNRYEMDGLYKSYKQLNQLSFLKKTTPERIKVKTLVSKNKVKQEIGYFREKEILFKNNFHYTI